jgi:hypothetical protein
VKNGFVVLYVDLQELIENVSAKTSTEMTDSIIIDKRLSCATLENLLLDVKLYRITPLEGTFLENSRKN